MKIWKIIGAGIMALPSVLALDNSTSVNTTGLASEAKAVLFTQQQTNQSGVNWIVVIAAIIIIIILNKSGGK